MRAEHKNTEEDLRAVYQKYNIEGGVVMGNRGVDPVDHSYPEFLRYCVGIDRDFPFTSGISAHTLSRTEV